MKRLVTISVIVPLYNKERHIERTLDSVSAQTFQDYEVIVVDDGSTDDGARIVESRAKLDERVRLLRQKNKGASCARNAAIPMADGKYCAFLDADDYWEPTHLEDVMAVADRHPQAAMIGTAFRRIFANGPAVSIVVEKFENEIGLIDDYFKLASEAQFIYTSSIAVATWALENEPGFPEGVSHGEDLELWVRLALRWPVAYCGRVTVNYRCGIEGQATDSEIAVNSMHRLFYPKRLEKHLNSDQLPTKVRKELKEYAEKFVLRSCGVYFQHGQIGKKAWRSFLSNFQIEDWQGASKLALMKNIGFYYFWRSYFFLCRLISSRKFLLLCGGSLSRNGIRYRLLSF